MGVVQLYGIGMEYPDHWDLNFHHPPRPNAGGFEIMQKTAAIECVVSVIWRPQTSVEQGHDLRARIGKAMKGFLGPGHKENPSEQNRVQHDPDDAIKGYCERIFYKIRKEQGGLTLIRQEDRRVNGHKADLSEFVFPLSKRRNKGEMRRIQQIHICKKTNRFIAVYGSTLTTQHEKYSGLVREMFLTLQCH